VLLLDEEMIGCTESPNMNWNLVLGVLAKDQLKRKRLLDCNKKKWHSMQMGLGLSLQLWCCPSLDYTGPNPIFNDHKFEHIYQISHSVFDQLQADC